MSLLVPGPPVLAVIDPPALAVTAPPVLAVTAPPVLAVTAPPVLAVTDPPVLAVTAPPVVAVAAAVLVACAVLLWPRATPAVSPARPVARGEAGAGSARRAPARRARPAWWPPRPDLLPRARGSRARADGTEEVQVLDGLAAALEAGLPAGRAVRLALDPLGADGGAAGGAWAEVARAAGEGQPLDAAWQRVARRTGSRTAGSVARAWSVAALTGAPVAAAVRTSAHAARERRRLERAVETATAGARATAAVLGLLPVAGVALAALLGIGPLTLYGHPLALASAGAGLLLLAVGHLTVRRMVARVLGGVA